jgi:glycosyltransferase involved in cell wall biosynthesis
VHVGLNLVFLVPGETGGMEVVARELIPALVAAAPADTTFTAFVNREAEAARLSFGEGVASVTVPVNARSRAGWVAGEQLHLPRLAARAGIDLLHSLASTAPARGRFRRIVTVHDLIYRTVPEAHGGLRSYGMRVLVPLAARTSHRITADSAATRDEVVRYLGVPAERVDVVPLGVSPPPAAPLDEAALRARHGFGDRRLALAVSAKRPHKNLPRLLEALGHMPPADRPLLVIPGYGTWHEEELRERVAALGIGDDVRLLGWVDDAELEGLFAAATLLVFPSLAEGFGLPVLEAMIRGLPVACSDIPVLREVAGDAAHYFDPSDASAMATALGELLTDAGLRARLATAGRTRASAFTWERTARGVLASYEAAMR